MGERRGAVGDVEVADGEDELFLGGAWRDAEEEQMGVSERMGGAMEDSEVGAEREGTGLTTMARRQNGQREGEGEWKRECARAPLASEEMCFGGV